MHTNLCSRLGITAPIIQAPMAGGWTTPELVSAVSEAGGLGILAAARLTATQLRDQIREVRRRTQRPYGVNFLIPTLPAQAAPDDPAVARVLQQIRQRLGLPADPPIPGVEPVSVMDGVEIALQARVPIISFAMGNPGPYVGGVHAAGALVMAAVTTVTEAEAAQALEVDVIVAQGSEAGGHRSTFDPWPLDSIPLIGTMALLPAVVDAVVVPVVAAGGIMDGRGMVAALALGAEGVQLGTRFLLATESGTPPSYRRQLLRAVETQPIVTDVFSGRAARCLHNAFIRTLNEAGARPLPWPRQVSAAMDIYHASYADDGEWAPIYAGQGVRLARREQPASAIVRELVAEARRVREHIPS